MSIITMPSSQASYIAELTVMLLEDQNRLEAHKKLLDLMCPGGESYNVQLRLIADLTDHLDSLRQRLSVLHGAPTEGTVVEK